jgi:hypothetical protein
VYAGAYKSDGTGGIWQSAAILPVELTTFTVSKRSDTAFLQWNTATEINNYGFDIEKRAIGKSEWNKIGFIKGNGTCTDPHEYSFIDKFPVQGKYSYRLKQIDNNGSFKYTISIEVDNNFTPTVFSIFQNFPNPFNPNTVIRYSLPFESVIRLAIYNSLGQMIELPVSDIQQSGIHEINFNGAKLSSGIYFYTLQANSTDGNHNYNTTMKMLLIK